MRAPARHLAWVLVSALGCHDAEREAAAHTGGDPRRGERAFGWYGCGSCHEIDGVEGAGGRVGPPLEHLGVRAYLAGQLPNTTANVIRWVRHPQEVRPGSVMPEMGVSARDARDLAAFLYTLR